MDISLQKQGLMADLFCHDAQLAELKLIQEVHLGEYISRIQKMDYDLLRGNLVPIDRDTSIGFGSLRGTLLAKGARCQVFY